MFARWRACRLLCVIVFALSLTSGLPGRRPVTPRACGARKKAPGRAVYDEFVNV